MRLSGCLLYTGLALAVARECSAEAAQKEGQPDTKEYLYQLKVTRPAMLVSGLTPEEKEILSQHIAYLDKLGRNGTVILYGRTQNSDESAFGMVIFTATSDEDAQRVMASDPGVNRGLMVGKLYPYKIAFIRSSRGTTSSTTGPAQR